MSGKETLAYNIADAKERPKFSDPEPHGRKLITPLGAAIVEAMPDRKLISYIKKRFKEKGKVPISSLFTANQIDAFYEGYDMRVSPVPRGVRTTKQKCPCIARESPQCGAACWHYGQGIVCDLCKNTGSTE
jgi:hypothetical protein